MWVGRGGKRTRRNPGGDEGGGTAASARRTLGVIDSVGRSRGSRGQKLDTHISPALRLDPANFSRRREMEEDRMGGCGAGGTVTAVADV